MFGALLFSIFTNDLPLFSSESVASIDLYADDTTLYDIQLNKQTLESNLQKSLTLLSTWCKENGILLNTDKTKVKLITSRQKRSTMENSSLLLKYNDLDLKLTNTDKILGVHINENLI